MRNGVGVRAGRKLAELVCAFCNFLRVDNRAVLADFDAIGLCAVVRQGDLERDLCVRKRLKRRNGDALCNADCKRYLARRVCKAELRSGVAVAAGGQRDGGFAARGLIDRAGLLVGKADGRVRGSEGEVHRRELCRLKVLEVDVAAVIIVRLVLKPQHVALAQVDVVGFPLRAGVKGMNVLVVQEYLQQIISALAVRNGIEAQLHILRRGKAQILGLVGVGGNAFEVVARLVIFDRLPRVGRIVRRLDALAVRKEIGEDEHTGQLLRHRDRAAIYLKAARHALAVRVRDGIGVSAVRKRRGAFVLCALERAHGGRAALDGDRVLLLHFLGKRIRERQRKRHRLLGKRRKLDVLGLVPVHDLDRSLCGLVAERRRHIVVFAGRDGVLAVRAGDGLAGFVRQHDGRGIDIRRQRQRVKRRRREVLEIDAVVVVGAGGIAVSHIRQLQRRTRRHGLGIFRPRGLIAIELVVAVAVKIQTVRIARLGGDLVFQAELCFGRIIVPRDRHRDLRGRLPRGIGFQRACGVVEDEFLVFLALVGRVVSIGDRRVLANLRKHVRSFLNRNLIGCSSALVGKRHIHRTSSRQIRLCRHALRLEVLRFDRPRVSIFIGNCQDQSVGLERVALIVGKLCRRGLDFEAADLRKVNAEGVVYRNNISR